MPRRWWPRLRLPTVVAPRYDPDGEVLGPGTAATDLDAEAPDGRDVLSIKVRIDAGVPVTHEECRGQTHTAFHAVDVLISPTPHRADMAEAVRRFFA